MTSARDKSESSVITLTPRQEELVELLAAGLSNKEIASQLGITYGTVKQHLFVLYRRLGVASRTKALTVVGQLLRNSATPTRRTTSSQKNAGANTPRYGWRMISVVSIYLSDGLTDHPLATIARDRYLNAMRSAVEHCADALDGRFASMPYGGLLAWFGHPKAHTDDADRAVSLALMAHRASEQYFSGLAPGDESAALLGRVGVAVASQAEIVAHNAIELLGAETFRRAAILARYASGLGLPLADDVTRRLAPLCVPWRTVRFREKHSGEQAKRLGKLYALGSRAERLPDARMNWGGLKFLDDVMATARTGIAQWLSVECWPSTVGVALTDAIGTAASLSGFQVTRVRLPSAHGRLLQTRSLCGQIDCFAKDDFDFNQRMASRTGAQDQLITALSTLCTTGPVAVLVYGSKGLERLMDMLGVGGVEALVSRRILLVCAGVCAAEKPQTALRLVGARPGVSSLSRVYSLKVPAIDQLSDRVRIGLQELLDSLSAETRSIIMASATDESRSFLAVARQMKLTDRQLKDCLNELTASGLVVPSGTPGGFRFRDRSTAQAIAELNVLSGSPNY